MHPEGRTGVTYLRMQTKTVSSNLGFTNIQQKLTGGEARILLDFKTESLAAMQWQLLFPTAGIFFFLKPWDKQQVLLLVPLLEKSTVFSTPLAACCSPSPCYKPGGQPDLGQVVWENINTLGYETREGFPTPRNVLLGKLKQQTAICHSKCLAK